MAGAKAAGPQFGHSRSLLLHADEIPHLVGKVHVLEGHGFVRDVTPSTAPIYRMSEDFVKYLNATR
jgi:hypothetical protein